MISWPILQVHPHVTTDRPELETPFIPVDRLWDQPVGWGDSDLVCSLGVWYTVGTEYHQAELVRPGCKGAILKRYSGN